MIRLLISLVIVIVAANVAIAHCKHRSHEIFYPSPHNEHINIDDVLPIEIDRHPHRKVSGEINSENLDDEIRKILPDILKENHHKGGRNKHRDDPTVHISLEFDDKGKLDIDENERIKPIHKIIKKDLPDWLDENHDWIIRDKQKNKKHKNDWEIKTDDSDIRKKEIAEWDLKDTERRVWENNKPYVNWDNQGVDYDKWNKNNNNNNGLDSLLNTNNNINLLVPEIVYDRSGDKNALVELNDNINGFISNTTKSLGDNLHNLETDLLNVKVNFKPLLSLNTKDLLSGNLNSDPITVKRKNERHLNNQPGVNIGNLESNWLRKQHQNNWDNENSRGVVKDRFIKVHEDERETDWSNKF